MAILNVRLQTLYAYVSRGLIRSVRQPGRRERLYWRDDLRRIADRSRARAGHGPAAASAMNWGEPIIPTSITEITAEGPRYRGRLAVDLARMRAPFESVADLIWTAAWDDKAPAWTIEHAPAEQKRMIRTLTSLHSYDQIIEVFALVTLQIGLLRGSVAERVRGGRTVDAGRQIIQTLVGFCGLATERGRYTPLRDGQTIVTGLLQALSVPVTDENYEAIEATLTLLADHELSPGTLAARVCASSGGSLHSCIAAAMCASSGAQTGLLYELIDDFIAEANKASVLVNRAKKLRARGVAIPGFVHPLYPRGDPRAAYLLDVLKRRTVQTAPMKAIYAFVNNVEVNDSIFPRHELAVVALVRAMGLPKHVSAVLFVMARVVGWIAHVQEQRLSGSLLRPRARFVSAAASQILP
ncbi:hypothetical protein LMG28614_06513 [Paraburkholderia ultramafica]|uniref:citrate synthase (unknown stereospecificity) n=2 Tax=Paraburkholderia ultramafica TaxID=1544867 RepID=A0A6S7DHE9_9BURK|nr:hypothetical protein LMG28614_06513 [Paraburkholderia ultramafica]